MCVTPLQGNVCNYTLVGERGSPITHTAYLMTKMLSEDGANAFTLLIFAAETIEVPLPKRNRIIGAGGHRIKALAAETGK